MKTKNMNKCLSLIVVTLLIATSIVIFFPQVKADPSYTEIEILPHTQKVQNGTQIQLSFYITPMNGEINMIQFGDSSYPYVGISFPPDKLKYVEYSATYGNFFLGKGTWPPTSTPILFDNDVGTIMDWGYGITRNYSRPLVPAYFGNLTFDVVGTGIAYINVTEVDVINNGTGQPARVTYNTTLQIMIGNEPSITAISPTNGSTGVNPKPTVSVYASDPDGNTMNGWINMSNADGGAFSQSFSGGNNTYSINSTNRDKIATYGKQYNWTVDLYDSNGNPNHTSYSFTLRGQYWPNAPTSFVATPNSIHAIGLSWAKGGASASTTYIMAKIGSTPTNRSDGTMIYNSTSTSTVHSGLSPSQHWYYAAWSYNNTDGAWSNSSATADNTTPANSLLTFTSPNPTNGSTGISISVGQLNVTITDPDGLLFNYSIRCSNGNSISGNGVSSGVKTLTLSPLAMNTTYTWWVNGTDDVGGYSETYYTFTTLDNAPVVIGTPTPTNGSSGVALALSWNVNVTDPELDTITWTLQCNNSQQTSGGGAGGNKALSLGGLAYSTTYTVWLNATDSGSGITVRKWFTFRTLDNAPVVIGTPTPTNGSSGVALALSWNVNMTDSELDTISWTLQCSNGQQTSGGGAGGNKALSIGGLAYLTTYTVWANATDSGNGTTIRSIFTFTTVGFYAPSSFTATTVNRFNISLTWTNDIHATTTLVRGKLGSAPTGIGDGLLICNTTGTYWTHATLNPGDHWYYAAWSYDATNGVWSSTNATANATTISNAPPNITDIAPPNATTNASTYYENPYMTINDLNGDLMTLNVTAAIGGSATETVYPTNTGLSNQTIYIHQPDIAPYNTTIYINVTLYDGYNWTNRSYWYQTGFELNVSFSFVYLNATTSGYNFVAQICPWRLASEIAIYLNSPNMSWDNSSNRTWEYITYWNASSNSYGKSWYNGTGAVNHNYSSGDVILISVLQNGTTYELGWAPSGSWEIIPLGSGINWVGRTVTNSMTASLLGANLTADGIDWTYLTYWDEDMQNWGASWTNGSTGTNFNIEAGDAIMVATNGPGSFTMYGW